MKPKIGTAKRKPIKTRPELVRYLAGVLHQDWDISVDEVDSLSSMILSRTPYRMTYVSIHCHLSRSKTTPFDLFVVLTAKTLLELIRRVERGELWDRIREEFEGKQMRWQQPAEPELLDEDDEAQPLRGIGNKQLALTYQPEVV